MIRLNMRTGARERRGKGGGLWVPGPLRIDWIFCVRLFVTRLRVKERRSHYFSFLFSLASIGVPSFRNTTWFKGTFISLKFSLWDFEWNYLRMSKNSPMLDATHTHTLRPIIHMRRTPCRGWTMNMNIMYSYVEMRIIIFLEIQMESNNAAHVPGWL